MHIAANDHNYFYKCEVDYQQVRYFTYSSQSTYVSAKMTFLRRHSLASPEDGVITKEAEASVMLTASVSQASDSERT